MPVRPDGHQVQVSADGTLTLYNVQHVDEGSYTCNAYAGTHAVSATAEIRITNGIAFSVLFFIVMTWISCINKAKIKVIIMVKFIL